jgi:hypothetical protein
VVPDGDITIKDSAGEIDQLGNSQVDH